MKALIEFLQGKKTYIGAGSLAAMAAAGYWMGWLPGLETGMVLALAFSVMGLGAKSDRYAQFVLEAIDRAKQLEEEKAKQRQLEAPKK